MGLKGYRLWVMGQLDSTCRAPPRDGRQRVRPARRDERGVLGDLRQGEEKKRHGGGGGHALGDVLPLDAREGDPRGHTVAVQVAFEASFC
jgi:hypothetical protein